MAAEMAQQPAVLRGLLERREEVLGDLRGVVPEPLCGIVLAARGSSDHAAVYARYLFELTSGRPVSLAAPSLQTLYGARLDYQGYLVVAISQSGRTPEIVSVLERAAAGGARTVSITNDPESPLADVAQVSVNIGAGPERAVPATKTFTGQLAALAIMAEAFGQVPWQEEDRQRLPDLVARTLEDPNPPLRLADEIGDTVGLVTTGRGMLYPIALEGALKLKETTGILAEGYSAADLRHGPIAVIQEGLPVLTFSTRGPAGRDMEDLTRGLRAVGARVFGVRDHPKAQLPVPRGAPESLVGLPMVVRAQQLAHALALRRQLDPDNPPGLSKVTMTR